MEYVELGLRNMSTKRRRTRDLDRTEWTSVVWEDKSKIWRYLMLNRKKYTPILCDSQGKVKVKCTLLQALRLCTDRTAHRGSRGIALPFRDHGTRKGGGVQRHATAALYPPGKTRYPLYRRLGGPQGRSGQVRKISPPPGFDPGPSSP
jgi:hypothetical protein